MIMKFSQEFELHPDVWSSIAVSLCLLKVLEMNQPESVLVLGDGDFLFSSFTQLLSKRSDNWYYFSIFVKSSVLGKLYFS